MKKIIILIALVQLNYFVSNAQSNPAVLMPGISINHLLAVNNGATRVAFNKHDSAIYYSCYNGNIYKVIIPVTGSAYDTLVYSITDHGIQALQGMEFYDSTLYVSGNIDPDSALTTGRIAAGKLLPNGTRNWYTLAQTVPYETAGIFDHLFSGMTVNLTGDTILICNGSRGDHGEMQSRDSLYPGLRNLPFTSVILQIPASSNNLIIPNDSAAMDALGILFARGIRNTYDFAYNSAGDLFGAENSGDRDMEDELNWLRKDSHYGFPWMMGSLYNPQQFAGYDTAIDLLINHNCFAWKKGTFYDDPTFPQIPNGLLLALPCKNNGPDASFMRDSLTGITYNAAAISQPIYSFTPHRSPLGLTFDHDSLLGNNFRGNGFVLSFTRGNALLNDSSPVLIPFNDPSEDLLMLEMNKDTVTDNYSFYATRIVEGFSHPIDAVLKDTIMFVIEYGYNASQSIWTIHFPRHIDSLTTIYENTINKDITVYPVPADYIINFDFLNTSFGDLYSLKLFNAYGQLINNFENINSMENYRLNTSLLNPGLYYYRFNAGEKQVSNGRFIVIHK